MLTGIQNTPNLKNMKNAICLHGISSGLSEKALNSNVDMLNVINNLKENLIIPNECDVFIVSVEHSWGI